MLRFLGLPSPARTRVPAAEYAETHAASLQGSTRGSRAAAAPMLNATRHRLQTFYAPHNRRLAALLGDQRFLWGARGEG